MAEKQFTAVEDLISELKKQNKIKPMSAKEEAAATKKLLDTQVEMLKLFEGGIPSDLSSGSKKAIMSAAQQAGIDVTEKQEDKSEETEIFLIQLAFKAKKERLTESKIKACKGSSTFPCGAGIRSIIADKISSIPSPVFALAGITSEGSQPNKSTISSVTSSGLALGKSTLLSTGIISKSFSNAKYKLEIVCA